MDNMLDYQPRDQSILHSSGPSGETFNQGPIFVVGGTLNLSSLTYFFEV